MRRTYCVTFGSTPVPVNQRLTIKPVCRGGMGGIAGARNMTHELVLTAAYRKWLEMETRSLLVKKASAKLATLTNPCVALLLWNPPSSKRRRDADGIVKAPFDVLTRAQIVKDDSLIKSFAVVSLPPTKKGALTMWIAEIDDDTEQSQREGIKYLLDITHGD